MTEEAKMKKAIRKMFAEMAEQQGEMKSDFEKYQLLVRSAISNLGEFRGENAEDVESVVGSPEQRKTGFDFGATREISDGQVCFIAITEGGMVFQPKRYTYLSGGLYDAMRDNGGIFKNRQACAIFCDYLNSLQSSPK